MLFKNLAIRLGAVLAVVVTLSSSALSEVPVTVSDLIVAQLKSGRADLDYEVIGKSAIAGFYEVQVQNGPILYVSADGNHFFDSSPYLVESGRFVKFVNILDMRLTEERRQLFADRDTADMIIFKPEGATKAIMNVFTDVDCGYCRKLHQEMAELNSFGIEVRYLAYPRAGIPSASYNKIATAWCAKDQRETLTKIKRREVVKTSVCADNPVADHYALGQRIGVTGTPAIILMDGTLIPGYQPAEAFAQILGLTASDS